MNAQSRTGRRTRFRVVRKNHFPKFVQPALADHPLRRLQRAARESFAAARRVPQRDRVRRRVKSDFVRARIRSRAVRARVNAAARIPRASFPRSSCSSVPEGASFFAE